mgnify:CR=1 FL=1
MRNISIITDSSSDLPVDFINREEIKVISQNYSFDDGVEYGEEHPMPMAEFYERMRRGEAAKTSASSPDAAMQIIQKELSKGNDVICITLSSKLSCTYNNIRLASLEVCEAYPDQKIAVIDSLSASVGEGLLIYQACAMRKNGKSFSDIVMYLEKYRQTYQMEFYVNELKYLVRGGRLSAAAGAIGGIMGIKPILRLTDEGTIEVACKARKASGAYTELKKRFLESKADPRMITIVHSDNLEQAIALKDELQLEERFDQVLITELGPTIGSHTGPKCLGIAYQKQH